MMSFHVIIGLGLPQLKILDTPMNWRSPEKKFLKTFFLENTCGCVLGLERVCPRKSCPCPWPRIFLFLASSLESSTPPMVFSESVYIVR